MPTRIVNGSETLWLSATMSGRWFFNDVDLMNRLEAEVPEPTGRALMRLDFVIRMNSDTSDPHRPAASRCSIWSERM